MSDLFSIEMIRRRGVTNEEIAYYYLYGYHKSKGDYYGNLSIRKWNSESLITVPLVKFE